MLAFNYANRIDWFESYFQFRYYNIIPNFNNDILNILELNTVKLITIPSKFSDEFLQVISLFYVFFNLSINYIIYKD